MRSRSVLHFVVVPLAVLAPFAAAADDIDVKSSLVGVTVFPAGAEIVREAPLQLAPGDHVVVLKDLPERLVDASLRVEGEADAGIAIGAVDSKKLYIDIDKGEGALSDVEREKLEKQIEALQDDKALLAARQQAAQTQRRLMERLTDLPASPPPVVRLQEGDAARYSDESWGRLFDLIGARMAVADDLIQKYTIDMRAKDEEIEKLQKRLEQQPPKQELRTEVRVAINARAAIKGKLKLKYQVQEASWRPFYDARLVTGGKGATASLQIERRAGIRQWSGEEWAGVRLALSTTSPQKGGEAPELQPNEIDLVPETPPAPAPMAMDSLSVRKFAAGRRISAPFGAEPEMMAKAAPAATMAPVPVEATEVGAAVQQYAFQAVFDIPGAVTIPTTGDEKKVAISTEKLAPELKLQTVPKLSDSAYLYGEFTLAAGATPLLPGEVSLYRDGTFTGNAELPHVVNPGDKHALGFGADEAVKVKRIEVKRQQGETGFVTTSQLDERRYRVEITNLHDMKVNMVVIDQIPYSVNEQVVVKMLSSTTPVSRDNVDGRRGILAWDFPLEAGAKKTINLDYNITWPANRDITGR